MEYVSYLDSPVGIIRTVANEVNLLSVDILDIRDVPPSNENLITKAAIRQLAEYFDGSRRSFRLPLLLKGTPFQCDVWRALADIPFGATVTYTELARMASHPNAVRTSASTVGKNRFLIVLPCHRVVSKKSIGGYSAVGGIATKRTLLAHERTVSGIKS